MPPSASRGAEVCHVSTTTVPKLVAAVLVAAFVGPSGIAAAHQIRADDDHACTGRPYWDNRSGVIRQDVTVYVQGQPTTVSVYAVQKTPDTGVLTVSELWLESNGAEWLQKDDFECVSGEHETAEPEPHPDSRLL